jgi:uncharacterized LabA/DUF88 family protein
MPLKTAIFVDGANFRANLRNFAFQSSPPMGNERYRLQEQHFNWKSFYRGVLKKFDDTTGWEHQLIRVHWYSSASISPWVSHSDEQRFALRVVNEHPEIAGLTTQNVIASARSWYDRERSYFERLRERDFENIQRQTDFLEFKYVGQYQVHPLRPYRIQRNLDGTIHYLGTQVGEKGVDIGIAVDMIAKMSYYDVAILVSGDADFLPVVGYLKDNLKYVYQFSVARGVPPSIQHLSPFLRGKGDCFESFDEVELLTDHLDRTSNIPPAILVAIDARVADLVQQ